VVVVGWWGAPQRVISVDFHANAQAAVNVVLASGESADEQNAKISASVGAEQKLHAVINVAGGWAGGNAAAADYIKNTQLMVSQSVLSTLIASHVAAAHLAEYAKRRAVADSKLTNVCLRVLLCRNGLFVTTGAKAALGATPGPSSGARHALSRVFTVPVRHDRIRCRQGCRPPDG
jgi:hypothetical protein